MDPEIRKIIEEQFNKLPPNLQRALNAVPWRSSIKEIALLNNIPLGQIEIVERETMFILYGFEKDTDYASNLSRELGVEKVIAEAIANAAATKIFKEVAEKAENPQLLKRDVAEELTQRVNLAKQAGAQVKTPSPSNLPVVEKGEVARDVPHVESAALPAITPKPPVSYSPGKDPYREPLN